MLFDIGWPELMLIGVVALVVIGPKDLPAALRVAGYWVKKARTMSREFQSSVEQMLREAELHEVQAELKKATEIDLDHEVNKIMDPTLDPALAKPVAAPADTPDYVDHTPAPADPLPPVAAEAEAEPVPVEPETAEPLPQPLPEATPAADHPAHGAEPPKP